MRVWILGILPNHAASCAFYLAYPSPVSPLNRELRIKDYFTEEWGYNATVIDKYIDEAEDTLTDNHVKEVAMQFAKFCKESKDCNKDKVIKDVIKMLQAIVDADGHIHPDEEKALNQLKSWFES